MEALPSERAGNLDLVADMILKLYAAVSAQFVGNIGLCQLSRRTLLSRVRSGGANIGEYEAIRLGAGFQATGQSRQPLSAEAGAWAAGACAAGAWEGVWAGGGAWAYSTSARLHTTVKHIANVVRFIKLVPHVTGLALAV